MDKVSICHACGRTVDSAFLYCPWCGTAAESSPSVSDQVNSVFEKIEGMQSNHTCSRIDRMDNELGEIEQALSRLLSGAGIKTP